MSAAPATPRSEEEEQHRAGLAHAAPFVLWLFVMGLLDEPSGWAYTVRTAVGVMTLWWFRPWRWYERINLRHAGLAVLVGLAVFELWVFMESPLMDHLPGLRDFYVKWAVRPLGQLRELPAVPPYDPAVCGWPAAVVRLLGSALIIPPIEEFFWRGFLYRWMAGKNFIKTDLGRFDPFAFLLVSLVFGIEHQEWLAGIGAGLAYSWLMIYTRSIWPAVLAHAVTNLVLGLYVLGAGAWQFW